MSRVGVKCDKCGNTDMQIQSRGRHYLKLWCRLCDAKKRIRI